MERGAWWATVHGIARVRHVYVTKPQLHRFCPPSYILICLRVLTDQRFVVDQVIPEAGR